MITTTLLLDTRIGGDLLRAGTRIEIDDARFPSRARPIGGGRWMPIDAARLAIEDLEDDGVPLVSGRGGARPGSGSPPNLDRTVDLLALRLRALSGIDASAEILPGLTAAQAERMTEAEYDAWFTANRDAIGL